MNKTILVLKIKLLYELKPVLDIIGENVHSCRLFAAELLLFFY